jgi:ankyrin repeat protein
MAFHSKPSRTLALAAALALLATPAYAQFSDGYNFLKAVKERKGEETEKYINEPGSVIVNTRDDSTGETALHIVVARRDPTWLSFLLAKGGNPNIADKKGVTPLMLATQYGFADGASILIKNKAAVDGTNRGGETALIRAVQLRNSEMVRLLIKAGANPDKKDAVSGQSAREYATLDGRASAILAIIENKGKDEPKKEKQGDLDFSGIGEAK